LEQAQQPKWAKMLSESHVDDDDSDHSDSGDGLGFKVAWKSLGYLIEYALYISTSVKSTDSVQFNNGVSF
jgi:hypothetical protein